MEEDRIYEPLQEGSGHQPCELEEFSVGAGGRKGHMRGAEIWKAGTTT